LDSIKRAYTGLDLRREEEIEGMGREKEIGERRGGRK